MRLHALDILRTSYACLDHCHLGHLEILRALNCTRRDNAYEFALRPCGQEVRRRGICGPELPAGSALCVTVPGAPALWEDTVKAFGKLSLKQVPDGLLRTTPLHCLRVMVAACAVSAHCRGSRDA